jgi:glucosyl-3-phosphoglycerate synthase
MGRPEEGGLGVFSGWHHQKEFVCRLLRSLGPPPPPPRRHFSGRWDFAGRARRRQALPPSPGAADVRHASSAGGFPEAWFRRRTSRCEDWQADWLAHRKARQGMSVSVVIPARNEERTVGQVVAVIAEQLVSGAGLVDELVVMDSDSTDATFEVAAKAGAAVYRTREVAPQVSSFPGKGEALWKSLLVTTGDLLVFVDADLTEWGPHFVTGLLGPMLADEEVLLVKGFYERLYAESDGSVSADGGRVTELVARPLLSMWWPELAGVVQPLAGEWAVRRALMESLSVPVGYGVELGVLLDTVRRHGLHAVAQVDLGSRGHRHQATHDLAVMAAELMTVAERRRPGASGVIREELTLRQFTRDHGVLRHRPRPIPLQERPPVRSLLADGVQQAKRVAW